MRDGIFISVVAFALTACGSDDSKPIQVSGEPQSLTTTAEFTQAPSDTAGLCPPGKGTITRTGIDVNGDGKLDISEVTLTTVQCGGSK